jgi:hypothetical protein
MLNFGHTGETTNKEGDGMKVPFHPQKRALPQRADGRGLEQIFAQAADFQTRRIRLLQGGWVKLYWLDGMVRTERLNDYVLRPLATLPLGRDPARAILDGGVWTAISQEPRDLEEAAIALADGSVALQVGRKLLLIPVPTEEKRSINSPEDEPAPKGAKDAFVEGVRTNTSLVRRRMRTHRLGLRSLTVGRESHTPVEVLWLEGLTDPHLVEGVENRIRALDVDALLNTQALTDALTDSQRTLFPLTLITQRPDRFCQGLLDGQVGVFCDGIAQGWLLPGTAPFFLRAPQDRENQWLVSRCMLAVRYLCVAVSLLLPAGYIAMASFHLGLMPDQLAETITASRQGVPLTPPLEVVLLLLAFEILQEAGMRLPQLNGTNVSIIGSLVVGQAAVEAKLLSPVVVVVVAAAGVAGYTLPDQDLANALRAVRFAFALLAALVGILGVVLGIVWLFCHLAQLEVLGVPWLAPFAPDVPTGPEEVTRVPVAKAKLRAPFLHPLDRRNQR